jgi:hypothetical protein
MQKKTAGMVGKTKMKIGAGLIVAGAAAAAGYYFYASPKAKTHRKIVAKWATDMKKEVLVQTKKLKEVSPKAYEAIVDRVAKTYAIARSVDAKDLKRAAAELKANWKLVQGETKKVVRKAARKTVSDTKKVVKAVAKRTK